MIAVPGDTTAATISAILADEAAIGMINNKTTATRLIPVPGAKRGHGSFWRTDGICSGNGYQPVQRTIWNSLTAGERFLHQSAHSRTDIRYREDK